MAILHNAIYILINAEGFQRTLIAFSADDTKQHNLHFVPVRLVFSHSPASDSKTIASLQFAERRLVADPVSSRFCATVHFCLLVMCDFLCMQIYCIHYFALSRSFCRRNLSAWFSTGFPSNLWQRHIVACCSKPHRTHQNWSFYIEMAESTGCGFHSLRFIPFNVNCMKKKAMRLFNNGWVVKEEGNHLLLSDIFASDDIFAKKYWLIDNS